MEGQLVFLLSGRACKMVGPCVGMAFKHLGPFGAVLGPLELLFGPSWALLGRYWEALGPSWGALGPSWRSWEAPWGALGPSRAVLGGSRGTLGGLGGAPGAPWGGPKSIKKSIRNLIRKQLELRTWIWSSGRTFTDVSAMYRPQRESDPAAPKNYQSGYPNE